MRLTERAACAVAATLRQGDCAVDATAGNGHDTLTLARRVGAEGRVAAFDMQAAALAATAERLELAGLRHRVALHRAGHEAMGEHLPADWYGRVGAVMFNLGYLPGADHRLTTRPATTRTALARAAGLLRPGGLLSVVAYTGHAGGRHEAAVVAAWCRSRRHDGWRLQRARGTGRDSPRWFGLHAPD